MSEPLVIPVLGEKLVAPVIPAVIAPKPAEKPIESTAPEVEKTPEEVAAEEAAAKEAAKPTPEQEEKQGKRRFERRLDKAYKRAADEKARADFLQAQLAEQRPQLLSNADPALPTLEGSGYDPEVYAKDLARYEVVRTGKEANIRYQAGQQQQAQEKLISGWEEKSDRGADKYADWEEKVGNIKPNSPMLYAVFEAENGDDIAHYLGSNPKEASRIMGLHPAAQIREIGKLEARLSAEPAKVRAVSKAPAPIVPVGGSSGTMDKKLSEMSQQEFEKRRRATIAARR